jgi:hypothetical protein
MNFHGLFLELQFLFVHSFELVVVLHLLEQQFFILDEL